MNPAAVTTFLSVLTVAGLVGAVFLALIYLLPKNSKKTGKKLVPLKQWLSQYAFHLALIVSLTATMGSLYFSEIAGYEPCKLCWYQRILMYPQVLLLGLSLIMKDKNIGRYLLMLSLIGLPVAVYHYYLQWGGNPLVPCSTVGISVDCSDRFVMQFGFVSIPFMSFTSFLLIALLMLFPKKSR
ncbi:MAG: disulfide bond formation protein DsbB, disulfide bond formation protein DsbB [Candidatus Gottesmanbacteria bacterium GW2011_GWA2_43_14]|uniref:Disulfide bond formation protein DsbB, disulfide bond formation protein DsbB n=1 Tax=Candidatus Gottesmanbacteria bacterium GW2011_GWA2_43_14 TaxID=1618443 RepID=A0A0G1GH90_9BACT|nr:MAG: disulfide bond formation protein DsbB, disulfide bond formation protein DsbB [Candidatus Gottesmanbacteria bacterium GW2011_GWA2_43_14]